jgi:putative transposase
MPEHVHVLLYSLKATYDMSAILKSIKLSVSRRAVRFLQAEAPSFLPRLRVTRPDGRVEHRFWEQGGGYDRNIYNDKIAWASVEYMHMNPVRRELCDTPMDWRWSSARWYAGMDDVVLPMDGTPG